MVHDEYDIAAAFAAIEEELIASMMRNMDRHRAEEDREGIRWGQWQVEQLQALEEYKVRNQGKYGKQFRMLNKRAEELIRMANEEGGMEQEAEILEAIRDGFQGYEKASGAMQAEFFKVNERKLEALVRATTNDMQKAQTAVLRMADDQYRKAIFNAQVYANTGAGTYAKAVDMATRDMLAAGLNCVQYVNGSRHTLPDYADMAIRTASKRAYLQGEGTKRQEWGIHTVVMNKRGNPCPKCLPWVGKVLIDDVWSGGKQEDGKYPLMSHAISKGLYHPRCKDAHSTYFPGISTADDSWTEEELENVGLESREEARQQYAGRQAEKYERLAKYSLDEADKNRYRQKADTWEKHAGQFRGIGQGIERISDHKPVSIFDLKSKYKPDIVDMINQAPENVQNFIKRHQEDVAFVNEHAIKNREGIKGIRVNLKKDAIDIRGKWCGTFHEIGHRVDRLAGRPSGSPDFIKALKNDFNSLVREYQKLYNINRSEAYREIGEAVKGARYHSISDLFGGMSDNQCVGDYAHRKAGYWEQPDRLGREAFAHFFEAYARADMDKICILRQTFPDAYGIFEKMIEGLE